MGRLLSCSLQNKTLSGVDQEFDPGNQHSVGSRKWPAPCLQKMQSLIASIDRGPVTLIRESLALG